jgi:type IV secretion system protein VirB10
MSLAAEDDERAGTSEARPDLAAPEDRVIGERGIGSINRVRSLQSRVSNLLAVGLLMLLAVGFLGWYYAHTYAAQRQARQSALSNSRGKAQGDMPLPSLGPIESPRLANASDSIMARALGPAPGAPPPEGIPQAWISPAEDPITLRGPAQPPVKSPEELALERKLSGSAFSRSADSSSSLSASVIPVGTSPSGQQSAPDAESGEANGPELSKLLTPRVTPAVQARVLPTQRLLLPKGAFIDCTLETAIDSTLPGMTTCVTATDTFGVDGSTVLLERGTKLVGETRGQVQQGAARVFVLWTEARTPTGVVIPLASPGTDELGRSGLAGQVNRHFFERFGAAILISTIDGVVQSALQPSNGGSVIYNTSSSQDILTEVLKSTVNIPPTVTKANGDRIQVLVARDLDFRTVYELRPVVHAR